MRSMLLITKITKYKHIRKRHKALVTLVRAIYMRKSVRVQK